MGENTHIEWATHTFNPWEGCQKVGPGCDHCYAETRNARFGGGVAPNWGAGAPRRRTSASNWRKPLAWQADAARFLAEHGHRQRVFCASLADVFDNAVDPQWRRDLFSLIDNTPGLDWLLLTKRIGNVADMLQRQLGRDEMPTNVWLGATIVNQAEADRDIPKLLAAPARVRFLSMEPLLGPVDLTSIRFPNARGLMEWWDALDLHLVDGEPMPEGACETTVDWVIVGGESGPGARPMHPDWARSLRDQCAAAGVAFLCKQWGEWLPTNSVDGYWHGPNRNQRAYPNSEGISWLRDGRICTRDFTVAEHARRMAAKEACCTRAIEVDQEALSAFYATLNDPHAPDLGFQWMYRVGKKAAGRLLDGVEHNGMPS